MLDFNTEEYTPEIFQAILIACGLMLTSEADLQHKIAYAYPLQPFNVNLFLHDAIAYFFQNRNGSQYSDRQVLFTFSQENTKLVSILLNFSAVNVDKFQELKTFSQLWKEKNKIQCSNKGIALLQKLYQELSVIIMGEASIELEKQIRLALGKVFVDVLNIRKIPLQKGLTNISIMQEILFHFPSSLSIEANEDLAVKLHTLILRNYLSEKLESVELALKDIVTKLFKLLSLRSDCHRNFGLTAENKTREDFESILQTFYRALESYVKHDIEINQVINHLTMPMLSALILSMEQPEQFKLSLEKQCDVLIEELHQWEETIKEEIIQRPQSWISWTKSQFNNMLSSMYQASFIPLYQQLGLWVANLLTILPSAHLLEKVRTVAFQTIGTAVQLSVLVITMSPKMVRRSQKAIHFLLYEEQGNQILFSHLGTSYAAYSMFTTTPYYLLKHFFVYAVLLGLLDKNTFSLTDLHHPKPSSNISLAAISRVIHLAIGAGESYWSEDCRYFIATLAGISGSLVGQQFGLKLLEKNSSNQLSPEEQRDLLVIVLLAQNSANDATEYLLNLYVDWSLNNMSDCIDLANQFHQNSPSTIRELRSICYSTRAPQLFFSNRHPQLRLTYTDTSAASLYQQCDVLSSAPFKLSCFDGVNRTVITEATDADEFFQELITSRR